MSSTAGTNQPEIMSASLAIGALEPCASSTRRMIWLRAVSLPTRVASKRKYPFLLTLPPTTLSPAALSTGRLSPVSMLSSTLPSPSVMVPSTGMRSPGLTITTSPGTICSMGTCCSCPSRTTSPFFGVRPISFWMASPVWLRERCSRNLPSMTRVMMVAVDSK